ncbi:MAG: carboxypeptidase M32 [Parasporobacterium sp.]|nr:carboxypeptidase M32 [Parasporobacterium sp.]
MTNKEKIARLKELIAEIKIYSHVIGKISFDMSCCAPKDGMAQAGDEMSELGKTPFRISHSDEYVTLLKELHADSSGLDPYETRMIHNLMRSYKRTCNQTPEFAFEKDKTMNSSYPVWLEAKKASDFGMFRDSLKANIAISKEALDLRTDRKGTYYEDCFDDFEPGSTVEDLEQFFGALKAEIPALIKKIKEEGKPVRKDFLTRPVAIPLQEKMSRQVLTMEGLNWDRLVFMTTEHPFTTSFGVKDVRVTTHYYEDKFFSNIFSTLHEGGHALFMQRLHSEITDNYLSDGMTLAQHECMSRFFENIIGRSEAFVHALYPLIQETCGDQFADVSEREFYEAINRAEPGLIRMEADELTYPMHILIRYELEKGFMNGDITVDELPGLWVQKYKEYLGVDVPDDARGVLQDMHWTSDYGYFPTYALGSAYGAQIIKAMEKDFDVFGEVAKGHLTPVADWLEEKAFQCACVLDPKEWMEKVTGEPFNVQYFIDYLKEKYSKIYGIEL